MLLRVLLIGVGLQSMLYACEADRNREYTRLKKRC